MSTALRDHLGMEGAICDAANNLGLMPYDDHAAVGSVHEQAGDVGLGHVGQLPGEDVLQRHDPAAPVQP